MTTATDGRRDAGLPPLGGDLLDRAGELLRALAAPVRIAIVPAARVAPLRARAGRRPRRAPALVSQHLRILKSAGVVAGERSGREVMYRLVDHHLAEIVVAALSHADEEHS